MDMNCVGRYGIVLSLAFLITVAGSAAQPVPELEPYTVAVFDDALIQFAPDDSIGFDRGEVVAVDNGRVVRRTVDLPEADGPVTIVAHLAIRPIPKDDVSMHDHWDRAGDVRLVLDDGVDVEIVKFVTAYGGATEYDIDVSHLAPLLRGRQTIAAFVDTWVAPAWQVDFSLEYHPAESDGSLWADGVFFEESFNYAVYGDTGAMVTVEIPDEGERVLLYYFVSGHCTDGRGADEFEPKDNVIRVDGMPVYRYRPWRDDCEQFRAINPYCRKWSDGYWSSDYSRSGWCPGDYVEPLVLDLSDHLRPGVHTIRFNIEDIRPEDEDGHFGYWRVSAFVVGESK